MGEFFVECVANLTDCPSNVKLSDGIIRNLRLTYATSAGGHVTTGCASPCKQLTTIEQRKLGKLGDPVANRYCCEGPTFHDHIKCRNAVPGLQHSYRDPLIPNEYVEWIHRSCPDVYAWQYDEETGHGLYGCVWGSTPYGERDAPHYYWTLLPAAAEPVPEPEPIPEPEPEEPANPCDVTCIGKVFSQDLKLKYRKYRGKSVCDNHQCGKNVPFVLTDLFGCFDYMEEEALHKQPPNCCNSLTCGKSH